MLRTYVGRWNVDRNTRVRTNVCTMYICCMSLKKTAKFIKETASFIHSAFLFLPDTFCNTDENEKKRKQAK